jgi:hypothetical protein
MEGFLSYTRRLEDVDETHGRLSIDRELALGAVSAGQVLASPGAQWRYRRFICCFVRSHHGSNAVRTGGLRD